MAGTLNKASGCLSSNGRGINVRVPNISVVGSNDIARRMTINEFNMGKSCGGRYDE
jgi:hypothetical protein